MQSHWKPPGNFGAVVRTETFWFLNSHYFGLLEQQALDSCPFGNLLPFCTQSEEDAVYSTPFWYLGQIVTNLLCAIHTLTLVAFNATGNFTLTNVQCHRTVVVGVQVRASATHTRQDSEALLFEADTLLGLFV